MSESEKARLRGELGLGAGLVLLGSSTWPGEETALIDALQATRRRGVKVSLLLVPRHAERREELAGLLEKSGLTFQFRSAGVAMQEVDVAVGDTTGELRKFTQLADLVFVGKSLAPHEGGQTPVEAAVLGKPHPAWAVHDEFPRDYPYADRSGGGEGRWRHRLNS